MSESPGKTTGTAPGERLRAERERRGYSSQKVAELLHVDVWVVEALETGRHESLGAPVYVKGHLRKYAALMELDAATIVSASVEQADPPLVVMRPKVRSRRPMRVSRRVLASIAAGAVVLAAAAWGYLTWRESQGASVAPAGTAAASQAVDQKVALAVEEPGASAPAQTVATAKQNVSSGAAVVKAAMGTRESAVAPPTVEPAARTVRVRLSFSADSWVELYDANQRRVYFDLGVANSARTFSVAVPARLFLGYADAVQVELDGQPVTYTDEVRRDNVAHFTFDARRRLRPAGSLAR